MADLTGMNFDPAKTEDMGDGFTVVPPGIYTVMIAKTELCDNSKKNGKVLKLSCQIIEGNHVGVVLLDNLNVRNPSEVSQKIGLSDLKKICDAIGFTGQLTDSEQLRGKPYSVQVEIEKFKSNTSGKMLDSNKIKKRMSRQDPQEGVMPAVEATPPASASTPASSW